MGCYHVEEWNPIVAEVGWSFFEAIGLRGFAYVELSVTRVTTHSTNRMQPSLRNRHRAAYRRWYRRSADHLQARFGAAGFGSEIVWPRCPTLHPLDDARS
jgi:hypothetical protein